MKRGQIILILLFFFLLANLVSAIDTEIKIKTMPGQDVSVAIGEANGDGNSWKFFKQTSDEYGDAAFDVSTNAEKFDLIVTIKKDGELLSHPSIDNPYKSYGEIAGESISLEIIPSWFTPIETPLEETNISSEVELQSNETEETTINETVEETKAGEEKIDDKKELTGSSVAEEHTSSSKTFYYGIGFVGLLMISFISFLVLKKTGTSKRKKGIEKLDKILDDMDAKGKPKKKKKDLVEDVKKKMKDIEAEMEELRDN